MGSSCPGGGTGQAVPPPPRRVADFLRKNAIIICAIGEDGRGTEKIWEIAA
jgi:hypothetical protein